MPAPSDAPAVDVLVVGSANLDLVTTTARLPRPGETVTGSSYAEHAGGKGLNQAVAAARAGATVAFVGAVGDDAAGSALRAVLDDAGIDTTSLVVVAGVPSGRAMITVDDAAENVIVVVPGANDMLRVETLPACRVLLVQLEIPLATVHAALTLARAGGATTIVNPAPAAALDAGLLGLVDVAVPNEHEAALLGGVEALAAAGVGTVVTTRGADGVDVADADGRWVQTAFAVAAVDPTAAGDAFCGYLAAGLAAGTARRDAIRRAAAAGALATTRRGAVPSIPDAAAVEALLGGDGAR